MNKRATIFKDVQKIPFFTKLLIVINLGLAACYFIEAQYMIGVWVVVATAFMLLNALNQILVDDYSKMVDELMGHIEWALKQLKQR